MAEQRELHLLRWLEAPARLEVALSGGSGDLLTAAGVSPAPPLEQRELSFWAKRGRASLASINFRTSTNERLPFLEFEVPDGALAYYPDGRPFSDGDSVQITLSVDTLTLLIRFEPSSLQFDPNTPARLRVWYSAADPDLNGDGALNSDDAFIETLLLGVWHQQGEGEPWIETAAAQTVADKQFVLGVQHFSGYAVSY